MLIFDQLKRNDSRLRWLTLGVAAGMFVLLAGLWWVQIVSAPEYRRHLETQSFRTVRIPAVRGRILDRNGIALAENRPSYSLNLYLEDLRDQFKAEYARLRPVKVTTNDLPFWKRWLGINAVSTQRVRLTKEQVEALTWQARYLVVSNVVQQIGARLHQPLSLDFKKFQRYYRNSLPLPCPVLENLDSTQIARFEEQSFNLMGVDLEMQSIRFYPFRTTAAHLLGEMRRDDSSIEGEDAYFSYRMPDYRGVIGIEYGYDSELHGHAGEKSVQVNSLGYRQTENIWTPAEPGRNVVLTIDLRIQQAAEKALPVFGPTTRGAAVVMDVNSGDILAMASSPTYDPNDFVQGFPPGGYQRVLALGAEKNRATQENYAPGSIFKPIVGLACLEAGLDPNATIYNPGYIYVGRRRIGDLAHAGEYDFRKAIMESCNTYFITNGLKAGIENIVKLGEELHLGERIGLPTRQETAGSFPSPKQIQSGWSEGDTANICIGQGYIAVTPLQMAVMTAALANGGKVLWPQIVDRIESQDPDSGEPPKVFPKGRVRDRLSVSPRDFGILKNAMLAEVEEGTGRACQVPGLRICGKTGTAQVMNQRNQEVDSTTWFISFAPYEKPRYAVVVMVESGSYGGTTCAPIAKKIYEAILERERMNAAKHGAVAQNK